LSLIPEIANDKIFYGIVTSTSQLEGGKWGEWWFSFVGCGAAYAGISAVGYELSCGEHMMKMVQYYLAKRDAVPACVS